MQPTDKEDNPDEVRQQQNSAADLIRSKLNSLYDEEGGSKEPDAKEEIAEVKDQADKDLSKHQKYMKDLSNSGRSLAEIQTAWHEYYTSLSDQEKNEVWQEFYNEHQRIKKQSVEPKPVDAPEKARTENSEESKAAPESKKTPVSQSRVPISNNTAAMKKKRTRKSSSKTAKAKEKLTEVAVVNDLKQHLLTQIQSRAEIKNNPHARALAFGLSMGFLTIFILLFSFFNEKFITPFVRPNANVSATPIIVDPGASGPVGPEAKIIIPKINVEAPVIYDVPSIEEKAIQKGLENGVVHYITTPNPGEKGNSVIFGHSSSNILNKGKYKFAFLMLKSLDKGDTFIVQKDGKRYVYKVFNEFVTAPNDFSVLNAIEDKPATMTLITCDPPGSSSNRLIIQAEQIFPDPSGNKPSSVKQTGGAPVQLPGNSESLWQRIIN